MLSHPAAPERFGLRVKSILVAVVTLVCLAFCLASQPSAAHANTLSASGTRLAGAAKAQAGARDVKLADGVYTIASAARPSAVLEVAGASKSYSAQLQAWRKNWTPAQRWRITSAKDGYYTIINVNSGKALGVEGSSVKPGTAVRQCVRRDVLSQKWLVKKDAYGLMLVSALSANYSLSFNGGKADDGAVAGMRTIRSGKAYRLRLTRITPSVAEGAYRFVCEKSHKPLQVASGLVTDGANVQQGDKGAALDRVFMLSFDPGSGYYRIMSPASGLFLDVAGGENRNRANVQLYSSNSSAAQLWAIEKGAGGTFTVRSATGGKVLDIADGSTATGANAQLFSRNGTAAQAWRIKSVKRWLLEGTYTFANCKNVGTVMSVEGSSTGQRANVQMMSRSNDKAQQWVVRYRAKAGAYTIRNKNSKLMLEVQGKVANKANVRQGKATGKLNQLWVPKAAQGGVVFVSAANPKVMLGVSGTNVAVFSKGVQAVKKFRLRDASIPVFKVYLNPGHGWNSNGNGAYDTGAQGSGYREADFAHDLAMQVQAYCESYGIEVVNGEQFELAYWERLPMAVSLGCNAIVSIHFDWSGAGRSGTHTMVGVQGRAAGSELLNDIIHSHLLAATGLPDLGTTYRSDITCVNGPIPSMLMEVCFMDNAYDVSTYLSRQDQVARAIADGILEASRQPELW